MKIYIAGPMTGLPDLNFPAFHNEARRLRMQGCTNEIRVRQKYNPFFDRSI